MLFAIDNHILSAFLFYLTLHVCFTEVQRNDSNQRKSGVPAKKSSPNFQINMKSKFGSISVSLRVRKTFVPFPTDKEELCCDLLNSVVCMTMNVLPTVWLKIEVFSD